MSPNAERAETRKERREMASSPADVDKTVIEAGDVLEHVGRYIRELRAQRNLTLQDLADRTGVSTSMLSLVERGKASPSIGTLVAISSALGVHMSTLFDHQPAVENDPVTRREGHQTFVTAEGVIRRILKLDETHGIEVVMNEYEPGTGSGSAPIRHTGIEIGFVLDGPLTVGLAGVAYQLRSGDSIEYQSETPHRIWNASRKHVRAFWVNFDR